MKELTSIIYLLSLVSGVALIRFLVLNLKRDKVHKRVSNKQAFLMLLAVLVLATGCSSEIDGSERLEKEQDIEVAADKEAQEKIAAEEIAIKEAEAKEEEAKLEEERLEAERLENERIEKERLAAEEEAKKIEEERLAAEKQEAEKQRKLEEEAKRQELAKNFARGRVTRHVDGDTVHVTLDGGAVLKVRMIGVDTPETVHPNKPVEYYGKEASDFTKNTIYNKVVYLEKDVSDTDQYGRSLRYIWRQIPDRIDKEEIENKMFNAILVKSGYANSATFPPDVKYQDYFLELEREARSLGAGLWDSDKAQAFTPPVKSAASSKPNTNKAPVASNQAPAKTNNTPVEGNFIGNRNSMKFHKASCKWASETSPRNRVPFSSRDGAIGNGYVPCKVCHP